MEKRRIPQIFLIAFILRFMLSFIRPDLPTLIDEKEYFYNGKNLEIIYNPSEDGRMYDYQHWYNRTPVYMLFRYLTQDFTLIVQMIFSSIGVVLMWKMNKIAGWIWCFYPVDVFYSFHYFKFSLMTFLIILSTYLWKKSQSQ